MDVFQNGHAMAAHQTSIESVCSEAAGTEALLALAHSLTTMVVLFSATTFGLLVLFLPLSEDVIDISSGLLILIRLLIVLLLIQVFVDLIHKV